ncbi:membrane protein [Priestia megaterium]|uniref:YczE/YyaS/YitT family protein n=1 Tax=Priestia megaterium TaxID=1404 RepID=UPI002E219FE3|nr:membrane protein [Priestia megaterium]
MGLSLRTNQKRVSAKKFFLKRLLIFLLGTFLLSLGMAVMIRAELGVSTWDVLHIGLSRHTQLSVGTAVVVIGFLLIALKYALDRKVPRLGTFANAILIGCFFNLIQYLNFIPTFTDIWINILFLILGVCLMGFGAGIYVSAGIGEGPRDGLTIAIANRFSFSIRFVRTILEATVLIVGFLLGGPVSIGTFLSIFLIGPIFQASLSFMNKQVEKAEEKVVEIRLYKVR